MGLSKQHRYLMRGRSEGKPDSVAEEGIVNENVCVCAEPESCTVSLCLV